MRPKSTTISRGEEQTFNTGARSSDTGGPRPSQSQPPQNREENLSNRKWFRAEHDRAEFDESVPATPDARVAETLART